MSRASRPLTVCAAIALLLVASLWLLRREESLAALSAASVAEPPSAASASTALEAAASAARSPAAAADPLPARARNRRRVLRGTVSNALGAPVAEARVTLVRCGAPGADDSVETDERGAFVLRYTGPGDYELVARAAGLGVTPLQALNLPDDSSSLEHLDLQVGEPDFLGGTLEDLEGHPLGGVELCAFPAPLAQGDAQQLFAWRGSSRALSLRGATSAFATTDRAGRFRFDGLAPGSYFLARRADLDPPHPARLLYATGSDSILLGFEGDCWLRLCCRDENGATLVGARVFCAPLLLRGPSDLLLEPTSERSEEEGAQWLFRVEPCRVYRCGFLDPLRGLVEEEVSIPCRGGTTERSLVMPAARGSGELLLDLPEFSNLAERHPRRVRVRSGASGVLLESWTQTGWNRVRLPCGSYVLEVAEPPARGPEGFLREDPTDELLLARREFTIEDGEATHIEVR